MHCMALSDTGVPLTEVKLKHRFSTGVLGYLDSFSNIVLHNMLDFINTQRHIFRLNNLRRIPSARFVGGWGLTLPLWCLSTPKFVLPPPPEKIVNVSQKYIADPPLIFPQIDY